MIFFRALGYDILRPISLSGIKLNFAWLFGRLEFLLDTICDSILVMMDDVRSHDVGDE